MSQSESGGSYAQQHASSYFPPLSPNLRAISPAFRRVTSSARRASRAKSAASLRRANIRSSSVSSSIAAARERGLLSEEEDEGDDDDDDEGYENPGPIAGPSRRFDGEGDGDDNDGDDLSTEDDPFTLKDRQSLINDQHPFGLPIWKPALYKKSRTVVRNAESALHSTPRAVGDWYLYPGNIAWTLLFGWWLALISVAIALVLSFVPYGGRRYAWLVFGLGWYLFWPFGKFVEGDSEEVEAEQAGDRAEAVADGGTEDRLQTVDETDDPSHPPRSRLDSASSQGSESGRTVRGVSTTPISRDFAQPSAHEPNPSYNTITQRNLRVPTSSWDPPATERTPLSEAHSRAESAKAYGATVSEISSQSFPPTESTEVPHRYHLGTIAFWLFFITLIAPIMLMVTLVCWGLVVTIPMAKLNWALLKHMFSHPLSIRFCAAPTVSADHSRQETETTDGESSQPAGAFTVQNTRLKKGQASPTDSRGSTILLCTYEAVGLQYYKYTVGGVNILFVNLIPIVFFVIFDAWVLLPWAERKEHRHEPVTGLLAILANRIVIFTLSLASVIPLSYFIGMAVASISAQSSIGMGAVINATFGSIIEIILYSIALTQGKGRLVEGSIVGSILAGVLLMPGASMCSAAFKKKEQKFNAKSASVTSTMLIMAIIGTLTPTLFYQTYGNVSTSLSILFLGVSDNVSLVPARLRWMPDAWFGRAY